MRLRQQIREHIENRPGTPALRTLSRERTWDELLSQADGVAATLAELGASPGAVVALTLTSVWEFIVAYCGTRFSGAIAAIVDPTDSSAALATLQRLRPRVTVHHAGGPPPAAAPGDRLAVDTTPGGDLRWEATRSGLGEPSAALSTAIAHVLFTSGSTRAPKGIVWSKQRLAGFLRWNLPAGQRCRGLAVPVSLSIGLHQMLTALVAGRTLAVLTPSPLMAQTYRELERLRVDAISWTPTQAHWALDQRLPPPACLETVSIVGAPMTPGALAAFAELFAGVDVSFAYGLSEIGGVSKLRSADLIRKPGSVGQPYAGRTVTICDPAGQPLAAGRQGEIVVAVPDWTPDDGYYQASEQPAVFADGVLRTGDQGYLDEERFLYLLRRKAELLKVAGRLVSGPAVAATLAGDDRELQLAVVGVPHRRFGEVPLLIYVPTAEPGLERRLTRQARSALAPESVPRWVLPRRTLPYTPSHKLQRGRLAEEGRRWVKRWPRTVALQHQLWPACDLARAADGRPSLVCIDGMPSSWRAIFGCAEAPGRRLISFAESGSLEPVAGAAIQDGVDAETEGLRIVSDVRLRRGSKAVPAVRDVLIRLAILALCLPGPRARAILAVLDRSIDAAALGDLRFGEVRGHEHCRLWLRPGGELDPPLLARILPHHA